MTLSTDIIVGFPGESEGQFRQSVDAIRHLRPNILNITRFSSRPGTAASRMKGHISGWAVKERSRELTAVHQILSQDLLYSRLGEHGNCLVTEVGKEGTMMARDINYTPIILSGDRSLLGSYLDITTFETNTSPDVTLSSSCLTDNFKVIGFPRSSIDSTMIISFWGRMRAM